MAGAFSRTNFDRAGPAPKDCAQLGRSITGLYYHNSPKVARRADAHAAKAAVTAEAPKKVPNKSAQQLKDRGSDASPQGICHSISLCLCLIALMFINIWEWHRVSSIVV